MEQKADELADLPALQAEVQRRVGRNVINFQKLEALLKSILTHGELNAPLGGLTETFRRKQKALSKATLGALAAGYLETASRRQPPVQHPDLLGDFSFTSRLDAESPALVRHKDVLALLVEQRNRLIHQLLPARDNASRASCVRLLEELDAQHALLSEEFGSIRNIHDAVMAARAEALSLLREELDKISADRDQPRRDERKPDDR
ncbi:MAG: hypothetical protein K0S16_688 [Moraxellaceae bacterium]|jgi:hypothetical protein|nr:hypothetical protein [Moraxellaceae bacterium]